MLDMSATACFAFFVRANSPAAANAPQIVSRFCGTSLERLVNVDSSGIAALYEIAIFGVSHRLGSALR